MPPTNRLQSKAASHQRVARERPRAPTPTTNNTKQISATKALGMSPNPASCQLMPRLPIGTSKQIFITKKDSAKIIPITKRPLLFDEGSGARNSVTGALRLLESGPVV